MVYKNSFFIAIICTMFSLQGMSSQESDQGAAFQKARAQYSKLKDRVGRLSFNNINNRIIELEDLQELANNLPAWPETPILHNFLTQKIEEISAFKNSIEALLQKDPLFVYLKTNTIETIKAQNFAKKPAIWRAETIKNLDDALETLHHIEHLIRTETKIWKETIKRLKKIVAAKDQNKLRHFLEAMNQMPNTSQQPSTDLMHEIQLLQTKLQTLLHNF